MGKKNIRCAYRNSRSYRTYEQTFSDSEQNAGYRFCLSRSNGSLFMDLSSVTPFEMADWSVKEPMTGDWKEKVRERIKRVDQMLVICGEHTDTATGVNVELKIAREEEIPYFLLWGRSGKDCKKPAAASPSDKIYKWTWDNLENLIGGAR